MKKILTVFALVLCLGFSSSAQIRMGAKAGFNAGWLPGTVIVGYEKVVPHNNFYAGIVTEAQFDMAKIALDVTYVGKGYSDRFNGEKYSLTLRYIDIPVLAGICPVEGLSVLAGPELGIFVGSRLNDNGKISDGFKEYTNPVTLNLAVQLNYMIVAGLGLDIKLDYGLTRAFNHKKMAAENLGAERGKNVGVQIGLCYKFDIWDR